MQRRLSMSLIALAGLSASIAWSQPAANRPPRPATMPSFTHALVLDNDAGDMKGKPARHFGLYLPADWQTTGTAGKYQFDDRYDPRGMSPDEPLIFDLAITHNADGTIAFEESDVTDAFFRFRVKPVDAAHFVGTWEAGGMFGPNGRPTSSSGKATLTVFRRPATRAD